MPPLTLALLRYAIGLGCLLPFAIAAARAAGFRPGPRDLAAVAALGIGQFGVVIALLNWGLQSVGAASAALIFGLAPLLTLLLTTALGQEVFGGRLLAGVLLSFSGVALSLWPKLQGHAEGWWGEGAVFLAACVGVVCSVAIRPWLRRYATLPISALAMGASVVFLAAAALAESWPTRVTSLAAPIWLVVAFVGLASGAGFSCWLYALKHESPTRVTVFLALNPLTAALLGHAWLGEALRPSLLGAVLLVGTGLWLATTAPPSRARGP